jgi:ribosomal protein L16/L10AE
MYLNKNIWLENLKYKKYNKKFWTVSNKGYFFHKGNIRFFKKINIKLLRFKFKILKKSHLNLMYLLIRKNLRYKLSGVGKKLGTTLYTNTYRWAPITNKPFQVRRGSGKGSVLYFVSPCNFQRHLFILRGLYLNPLVASSFQTFKKFSNILTMSYNCNSTIMKYYLNILIFRKLFIQHYLYSKIKKRFRTSRLRRRFEFRRIKKNLMGFSNIFDYSCSLNNFYSYSVLIRQ